MSVLSKKSSRPFFIVCELSPNVVTDISTTLSQSFSSGDAHLVISLIGRSRSP